MFLICAGRLFHRLYIILKYRYDPARALISQKPMFYQSINHGKSVLYCFARVKSGHLRTLDKRRVFSTFPSCSQMTIVFYHSVIHGLGFIIC